VNCKRTDRPFPHWPGRPPRAGARTSLESRVRSLRGNDLRPPFCKYSPKTWAFVKIPGDNGSPHTSGKDCPPPSPTPKASQRVAGGHSEAPTPGKQPNSSVAPRRDARTLLCNPGGHLSAFCHPSRVKIFRWRMTGGVVRLRRSRPPATFCDRFAIKSTFGGSGVSSARHECGPSRAGTQCKHSRSAWEFVKNRCYKRSPHTFGEYLLPHGLKSVLLKAYGRAARSPLSAAQRSTFSTAVHRGCKAPTGLIRVGDASDFASRNIVDPAGIASKVMRHPGFQIRRLRQCAEVTHALRST
jgi:hypothetical protein